MADEQIPVELVAATYPNMAEAKRSLNNLVALNKADDFELIDAAVLMRNEAGNLFISERASLTAGKGARRGALIGAALGVVFPPSLLASAALGAAAGAVTGKAGDHGLNSEILEEIAGDLEVGHSTILALAEARFSGQVLEAVAGYDTVARRSLTADESGNVTFDG